ncbi:hypothetical protein L249_7834 [Ophiocordyceps polyrhachis-furcata BCC 54312]|uniref:FAR-17a/AIG1-like protein n=1 Tax=Ophiocordyceps polyrhachis-furcata BCC 54312 TaxID=1330021 RepID=A0A367L198_9HYPO|nr:hypothetical protein L249_7834 [Ophiocordyceps polyrhachis-furcata BCC 54312]
MGRRCFAFGAGPWDPDHRFETSSLVRPWTLFLCRAAMCIYAFFTIFFIIIFNCTAQSSPPTPSPSQKPTTTAAKDTTTGCASVPRSFSYFTVLCYWGLAFYFLFASLHTFSYARTARPLLLRFSRPLQALHALLYSSIVVFPFIVTLTYWAVLFRSRFPTTFDAWRDLSQHALNSIFALFEIIVPRTSPLPWLHLLWLAICLLAYLAVAFITLADQGFYVYAFLDYRQAGGRAYVAAYVLGITFALVLIFCAVHFLIRLRCWMTESKLQLAAKYAREPVLVADVEVADVETKAAS